MRSVLFVFFEVGDPQEDEFDWKWIKMGAVGMGPLDGKLVQAGCGFAVKISDRKRGGLGGGNHSLFEEVVGGDVIGDLGGNEVGDGEVFFKAVSY